jgi:hypothetical protein
MPLCSCEYNSSIKFKEKCNNIMANMKDIPYAEDLCKPVLYQLITIKNPCTALSKEQ